MNDRITAATINEAHDEFKQRLRETGRTQHQVVVAEGITLEDLEQIPRDWLEGIDLLLLMDGTLIVDRLLSRELIDAEREAFLAVAQYAKPRRALGLRYSQGGEIDLGVFGRRMPSAILSRYEAPFTGYFSSLVAVEIITGTPSCHDLVNAAAGYLYYADAVERVVLFQIFPPVSSPTSDRMEVPALATVFGFENRTDPYARIKILEIKSFGNTGIKPDVVESLVSGVSFPYSKDVDMDMRAQLELLDRERGHLLLTPGIPMEIHEASVLQDVEKIRAHASPLELRVPLPEPLEDLVFDLVSIFTAAIEGRYDDNVVRKQRLDASDSESEMCWTRAAPMSVKSEFSL